MKINLNIIVMSQTKFELKTLCLKFEVDANGDAKLRVRDSSTTPSLYEEFDVPTGISAPLHLQLEGSDLKITAGLPSPPWSKTALRELKLYSESSKPLFQVTRNGTGIGIADIRDGLSVNHIYDLGECPVLISKSAFSMGLNIQFEDKSLTGGPRPNIGYDFFNRSTPECS